MKLIRVKDAKPGVLVKEMVVSPRGQILALPETRLTAQQLLHMMYYGILELKVADEDPKKVDEFFEAPDEFIGETMSWRVVNSEEFRDFKKSYDRCTARLEVVIDEFITRERALDDEELLAEIRGVFDRHATGLGIMAMLLNMQGIDPSTYAHSVNVAIISRVLGIWMGMTNRDELDVLTMCGLFHDIGKSLIPEEILLKPGKLTVNEYARICEHPLLGYHILTNQPLDRRVKLSALQHHERCDGSGYPYGLSKVYIDDFAMMVAIADVYDAMTADRCYRAGVCPFEVIAQFQREPLDKFDPKFLITFINRIAESYVGAGALLSDGSRGMIALVKPEKLASPLIKLDDGSFVDLAEREDLYIRAIV